MAKRSKQSETAGSESIAGLQRDLGWQFRRPELLRLALTHRSFSYEARGAPASDDGLAQGRNPPGQDNEQLEFLGDAVLGLAVTEALYRAFPACSEGELTRLRASLVSRERMAQLGAALQLRELLLLGKSAERGRTREKPTMLANAAEAVLAAVYLDAGESGFDAVRQIVNRYLVEPDLPMLRAAVGRSADRGALRDSKTLLQERVQAERTGRLLYADAGQSGPAHQRRFVVEAILKSESGEETLARGEGSSKKEAQQRAAAAALEQWPERKSQAGQAEAAAAS